MSVVYTGGTFDTPHFGHLHFLWQCKRVAGDEGRVVVSLNTDDFVLRFKGRAPLMTYREREKFLRWTPYVSEIIPNEGGEDSKPAILKIKPNFIVVGSDWAKKDYYTQMQFTQDWLDERGIVLVYVPYTEGISSTELKRRLNES